MLRAADCQGATLRRIDVHPDRFGTLDTPPAAIPIEWRYRSTALFGEKVKWLPPYRLVPSFASADGQTVVYRRRSQVVLTEENEDCGGAAQATTFAVHGSEYRVRIDQYGYARLIRPTRSQQHVDPLSNLVDGAADMEREAALTVCSHLNEHVDAIGFPQRWTPAPTPQLVPLSVRQFSEPMPEAPRKHPGKESAAAQVVHRGDMEAYLDARAKWLARRFAWESGQRSLQERSQHAAAGDLSAMQEHLLSCLHDVLWPVPTQMAYRFDGTDQVRIDVLAPGFDVLPDREAAMTYGNRVSVQRAGEVNKVKLHNRHAQGLVLRLFGEVFAALPTVQNVMITALSQQPGKAARYIISAMTDRKSWVSLYANGTVTADAPEPALHAIGARFNLTGLGAFIPIQPLS
jgi:hypothetical protein